MAARYLQPLEQQPDPDVGRMRLELAWRRRQLLVRPRVFLRLAFRRNVRQLDVRVRDDRLLDVFVDRGAPLLIPALDLHGDLRAAGRFPGDLLLLEDARLVLLRIDLDFEVVGGGARAGAGGDLDGLAGRELAMHAGRRDADALLAPAHAQPMELGPVQQLREDRWDLLADDPGTVVGHRDPEAARLARGGRRAPTGDGRSPDAPGSVGSA